MKVNDIVAVCESIAPPELAAEWDNVGLLVGDADAKVARVMLCIDLTAGVLEEARKANARMVLAYHPVIFKPISRITSSSSPVAYAAARAGVAVYSMHTALDAAAGGTNDVLADAMGLQDRRPIEPVAGSARCKLVVFVPPDDLSRVAEAAFTAGAGRIGNYHDCAFFCHGIGAFSAGEGAHPAIGAAGHHEVTEELRLEIIAPRERSAELVRAVRAAHSYEQPAIDLYPLEKLSDGDAEGCGMGRIGRLPRAVSVRAIVDRLKKATGVRRVLLAKAAKAAKTSARGAAKVKIAACCAGSCGSLYKQAADAGADVFVTGEMRHHDALAAAALGMTVVCLGHSNSERITLKHLAVRLRKLLPKLDVTVSRRDADPFEIV